MLFICVYFLISPAYLHKRMHPPEARVQVEGEIGLTPHCSEVQQLIPHRREIERLGRRTPNGEAPVGCDVTLASPTVRKAVR